MFPAASPKFGPRSPVKHLKQLRFGQGQTQIGNIAGTIWPDDLHDIGALQFTFDPRFDQPQKPPHPSPVPPTLRFTAMKWDVLIHPKTANRAVAIIKK
jgi:hypothetical protein